MPCEQSEGGRGGWDREPLAQRNQSADVLACLLAGWLAGWLRRAVREGHLRVPRLRRAALQLRDEVRLGNGMALLLRSAAGRRGLHRAAALLHRCAHPPARNRGTARATRHASDTHTPPGRGGD
eukprot:scaffold347_cov380-Prasinococcus_capsulatus_cf.AAC.41